MNQIVRRYAYRVVLTGWLAVMGISAVSANTCQPPPGGECGCLGQWELDEPSCVTVDLPGEVDLAEGDMLYPFVDDVNFCSREEGGGIGLPQTSDVILRTSAKLLLDSLGDSEFLLLIFQVAGLNTEVLDARIAFKGEVQFKCNNNVIKRERFKLNDFHVMGTNRFKEVEILRLPKEADEFEITIRRDDTRNSAARVRTTSGSSVWRPIQTPELPMTLTGRRR